MAFEYAGSLDQSLPVVRNLLISETCYVGQMVISGHTAGVGGHVQIMDIGTETYENDVGITGIVTGVVDGSRTYNSTYNGDRSTYTTTQATIASDGPGEVQVTIIRPWATMIKGPICYSAYKTAPTLLTATSADSTGLAVTDTGNAITDTADDFSTIYCRTGANRGVSRVVTTTTSTTVHTVTIPFPYGIAIGDTFVKVAMTLGLSGIDILSTADCINGDVAANFFPAYIHEINLEEAGKEYAVFSLISGNYVVYTTT